MTAVIDDQERSGFALPLKYGFYLPPDIATATVLRLFLFVNVLVRKTEVH
ncbi:hypothetical protein [Desulfosporosinus lacus]|nr:hypothetical protein [Desulfosporosinus lacus]